MQYLTWRRSINNAVACLISLLDCLAPFTAAYSVCVCVCVCVCGLSTVVSKPEEG